MRVAAFNFDLFTDVVKTLNSTAQLEISLWYSNTPIVTDTIKFDDILNHIFKNTKTLIDPETYIDNKDELENFRHICERHYTYSFNAKHLNYKEIFIIGVNYFIHTFKKNKIEYYINSSYPHEIVDYLAYVASRRLNLGIKFLVDNFYSEPPTFQVLGSLEEYSKLKEKNIRTLSEKFRLDDTFAIQLQKEFGLSKKKLLAHANNYNLTRYRHLHEMGFLRSLLFAIKLYNFLGAYNTYKKLAASHHKFDRFVLCALHHQPEGVLTSLSTSVGNDQLMFLVNLRRRVPSDVPILVKENPVYSVFDRSSLFYKIIASLENTYLVDQDTDVKQLIPKAIAVASVCGNIGLEALIHRVPAIYEGYPMYRDFKGAIHISEMTSFEKVVKEQIDLDEVLLFWIQLNKQSYRGCNTKYRIDNLTDAEQKENMSNILFALLTELNLPHTHLDNLRNVPLPAFQVDYSVVREKEKIRWPDLFLIICKVFKGQFTRLKRLIRFVTR